MGHDCTCCSNGLDDVNRTVGEALTGCIIFMEFWPSGFGHINTLPHWEIGWEAGFGPDRNSHGLDDLVMITINRVLGWRKDEESRKLTVFCLSDAFQPPISFKTRILVLCMFWITCPYR